MDKLKLRNLCGRMRGGTFVAQRGVEPVCGVCGCENCGSGVFALSFNSIAISFAISH